MNPSARRLALLPPPEPEAGNDVIEPGREFLTLVRLTARLARCRWVLAQVVVLAQRCPELSDEQLRVELAQLGAVAAAARGLDGDPQ